MAEMTKGNFPQKPKDKQESGYVLVGLMGVMLFALILMTAAAPAIKYESQREREEEMLWRGHQIQRALAEFKLAAQRNQNKQYPTSLNELVEGVSDGIKKIRFLRPSALCDPMTPCVPGESNWQLVHPGDPLPNELLNALVSIQQQQQIGGGPTIMVPPDLRMFAQMGAVKLPGQESESSDEKPEENTAAPSTGSGTTLGVGPAGGLGFDASDKKPIIGVVSSKSDQMFRSYYGIDQYDHALFFPGVPVVAGGFNRAALAPPVGAQTGASGAAVGGVPGSGVPGAPGVQPQGNNPASGIRGTTPTTRR
jgi:type II secretory pathway pseudopilin PulG